MTRTGVLQDVVTDYHGQEYIFSTLDEAKRERQAQIESNVVTNCTFSIVRRILITEVVVPAGTLH